MKTFFGNPIVPTPSSPPTDCYSQSAITNPKLKQLLITENVGPFSVTGLKPVIDTLKKIFAEVEKKDPKLYSQLSNEGMLCVRPKKKNGKYRMGTWSNHAWGAAIDIRTKTQDDKQGDNCTLPELSKLYPYFHQEGFYWGAGYSSTEDSMHFEASTELLQKWRTQGLL